MTDPFADLHPSAFAAISPDDEAARLSALEALGILDTPQSYSFDRVTEFAAFRFSMDAAFISLIDRDRQWFKSGCGLNATQTPRSAAFCDYTIRSDAPLVVPDALAHPVFQTNPLVTGPPYVRFYAGAPLLLDSGVRVGALCLLDGMPQDLGDDELRALQVMARQATKLLHAHGRGEGPRMDAMTDEALLAWLEGET